MPWLYVSLLCLGLGLGAWSCGPTHCGYNGGDAACAARDPNTPFCNLCLQENDGCLAVKPTDAGCVLIGDSGSVDTLPPSTLPPVGETTYEPDPTTQGPSSLPPETTDPTFDPSTTTGPQPSTTSSSTSSDETTDVSTSSSSSASSSTDDTTSGSTSTPSDDTTSGESTSTTSDETTGPPPPMCGNDMIEGSELCDGSDLAGKQCTDFAGKGGGTLACDAMCSMYDLAACCLANGQACNANGDCCINSCKFDLLMGKKICK